MKPQDNAANMQNRNQGTRGTNRQNSQNTGNTGKQLNPNQKIGKHMTADQVELIVDNTGLDQDLVQGLLRKEGISTGWVDPNGWQG
jgi:hypothetical protein